MNRIERQIAQNITEALRLENSLNWGKIDQHSVMASFHLVEERNYFPRSGITIHSSVEYSSRRGGIPEVVCFGRNIDLSSVSNAHEYNNARYIIERHVQDMYESIVKKLRE